MKAMVKGLILLLSAGVFECLTLKAIEHDGKHTNLFDHGTIQPQGITSSLIQAQVEGNKLNNKIDVAVHKGQYKIMETLFGGGFEYAIPTS